MDPIRTCIGCRSRAPRHELLRFVAESGRIRVDHSAVMSGRGAWAHASAVCLESALSRGGFARAFRTGGLDIAEVRALEAALGAAPAGDTAGRTPDES